MKCYMGHFGANRSGMRKKLMSKVKPKVIKLVDENKTQEVKSGELERVVMEQQPQNKVTLPYGRARITPEMQKQIDAQKESLKQIQLLKLERANSNAVNAPNLVSNLLPQSSVSRTAILDTAPAQVIKEAPILKPDEQPKKSNTGLIVGAAALGIAAYLYTQE